MYFAFSVVRTMSAIRSAKFTTRRCRRAKGIRAVAGPFEDPDTVPDCKRAGARRLRRFIARNSAGPEIPSIHGLLLKRPESRAPGAVSGCVPARFTDEMNNFFVLITWE